ncbi:MAG: hypothetical protein E7812_12490 [Phenylobacterium sp.]|nr:MAG: hypothetical protein E7812_12490 [Phenylobacterium sp.]
MTGTKSDRAVRRRMLRPWFERKGFSILGCFVAGALAVFLVELLFDARHHSLWSQEAAGWAQAFGTVAAIIFAWWQGDRSVHLEERRKRDDMLRFLGSLAFLVESAGQVAEEADRRLAADDMRGFAEIAVALRDKLKHFQKVSEIPVQGWPSAGLATDVDFCREELEELFSNTRTLLARPAKRTVVMVTDGAKAAFHERTRVLVWRCRKVSDQIAFYRSINEPGPGPWIIFGLPGGSKQAEPDRSH